MLIFAVGSELSEIIIPATDLIPQDVIGTE